MPRKRPFPDLPIDPDLEPDDPSEPQTHTADVHARTTGRRARPGIIAAIAIGGSLGTLSRAALGTAFPVTDDRLPFTTLGINLVGSFVLGFLIVVLLERLATPRLLRPFLTTGYLGGFTTFSTFMVESVQLGRHGHPLTAATYLIVAVIGGIGAAWLGIATGNRVALAPATDGATT